MLETPTDPNNRSYHEITAFPFKMTTTGK